MNNVQGFSQSSALPWSDRMQGWAWIMSCITVCVIRLNNYSKIYQDKTIFAHAVNQLPLNPSYYIPLMRKPCELNMQ